MSVKLMYNILEENFMIVVDFMGAQHINTINKVNKEMLYLEVLRKERSSCSQEW